MPLSKEKGDHVKIFGAAYHFPLMRGLSGVRPVSAIAPHHFPQMRGLSRPRPVPITSEPHFPLMRGVSVPPPPPIMCPDEKGKRIDCYA